MLILFIIATWLHCCWLCFSWEIDPKRHLKAYVED